MEAFLPHGIGAGTFFAIAAWTFFWKGFALWFAAKEGQRWWFIALLILNTLAILEIVYIFAVAKKGKELGRALGFQ